MSILEISMFALPLIISMYAISISYIADYISNTLFIIMYILIGVPLIHILLELAK